MGKIEEVQQAAADLQSAVDAKQQQLAEAFTAINIKLAADAQTIKDLQAIIDAGNGATPEQLDTLLAQITTSREDLAATPTA